MNNETTGVSAELAVSRTAVVVLGMHRSGTSAIAGTLAKLGCTPPKTLISSTEGNVTGHWESDVIRRLDDDILRQAQSSWADWTEIDQKVARWPGRHAFREQAVAALEAEYGAAAVIVLKEPRICRFPTFWLEVLAAAEIEPVIVLPIRNPAEVVASLTRRSGIPPATGLLMWLRHTLDAEYATRGVPRAFTSYQGLLADWRSEFAKVEALLPGGWPRPTAEAGPEIGAFLQPASRHHCLPTGELQAEHPVADLLNRTYGIFDLWSRTGERARDFAALDVVRNVLSAPTAILTSVAVENNGPILRWREAVSAISELANEVNDHSRAGFAEADPPALMNGQLAVRTGTAQALMLDALFHAYDNWPVPGTERTLMLFRILDGTGLFDAPWYIARYADVAAAGMDPLMHFVAHGYAEGRRANAVLELLSPDDRR